MRTERLQRSILFRDLAKAIDAELFYCLRDCLGRDARPEVKDERYKITDYPEPLNDPQCWCPEHSLSKCTNWNTHCPSRPILKAGKDFQIVKCPKDHSMNSHQPCNRKECWSHKGVVKNWLRLVCHGLDTMAYEPKMDAGLQFDVLHAVAGYRFDDPYETSSFASLICIIIEELRFPGGQLGSSWMPELHGIIWLEDKSAKETVDVMVNLLTKAKQKREAKESRRRRGSRSRR